MLVIDDILMYYLFQSISIVIGDPRRQDILTEKNELGMMEQRLLGILGKVTFWNKTVFPCPLIIPQWYLARLLPCIHFRKYSW